MIFNLFKSEPTLKELIPDGFVDIHSHILPGIDDGAKNINESINLIETAEKLGFSKIIATPHIYQGIYNNNKESIKESYLSLINSYNSEIKISYASEYMIDINLIELAQKKSLITLDGKHVLIEFSFVEAPKMAHEIIFGLQTNGFTPILAHPERYIYYAMDFKKYFWLKDLGCKFQINLNSCTGYYGKTVLTNTNLLFKNNLIDFTGTDMHNITHLEKMTKKIQIKFSDKLQKCMESNSIF